MSPFDRKLIFLVLILAATCSAQQATTPTPAKTPQGINGPIIGGDGTRNYIAMWGTPNYVTNSVIYQASGGNIGVGTTTPAARLDVNGTISASASYQIGGYNILSVPGAYNLFVGQQAGASNTTGTLNLFVGLQAGSLNTSGWDNTFAGMGAGENNSTGSYNSFFGSAAGAHSTGSDNTFVGVQAGSGNPSTGWWNTAVGMSAGGVNTSGSYNAFYGGDAGGGNTTGSNNVFVGHMTGVNNTGGSGNTFTGYNAGFSNTNGQFNAFYGYQAGYNNITGSSDVYVSNAGPSSGSESNTIRIGDPIAQTAAYIAGIYNSTATSGLPVYVNSTGQLGTLSSSLRFKEQVRDMGNSTDGLMKLRPVTFLYKSEYESGPKTLQYGLIAEEVSKVYPELVAYDNDGQPYSVKYQYLGTMLLNEVQKQYQRAEAEAAVIRTQQEEIDGLERRLTRLEGLLQKQGQDVEQK